MAATFHANQVTIAFGMTHEPNDPGETLLIFDCLCPTEDGGQESMGRMVIGMTHAHATVFARLFHEHIEEPPTGRYRGPRIQQR